jgi:membrane associated rhomboid family serine protease
MVFVWVSFIEYFLNPLRSLYLFLLTGFAGSMFSVAITQGADKTMGASAGIFGIFGASLSYLIFNWNRMNHEKSPR